MFSNHNSTCMCFRQGDTNLRTVEGRDMRRQRQLMTVVDDLLCDTCKLVVVWIHNQMKQGNSKKQTLKYVGKLCKSFPASEGDAIIPCDRIQFSTLALVKRAGRQFVEASFML